MLHNIAIINQIPSEIELIIKNNVYFSSKYTILIFFSIKNALIYRIKWRCLTP